ncbi:2,3-bisphosphoglycerate-independent phosphoglycerate mutase [Candidatus Pacearchaeota archaeon]|nr:2,3-bisphosphoglycerate-independent phosphoglycerate mutase [Candidatus Pacearchaeota archaeon]
MKKILVIVDGMGDLPNEIIGNKTPLEAANISNLNELASKGKLGFVYPIDENYAPESDTAIVSLLGNNFDISERAIFEAIGENIKLKRGDLVLRANFGTTEDIRTRKIVDRRAGRTLTTREATQLARAINSGVKLPAKFKFFPTVQHRGILVFYGGFSDNLTDTDTYVHEKGRIEVKERFDWAKALDEEENSEFGANLINSFIDQSYKILNNHPINKIRKQRGLMPANIILTRDAGVEKPEIARFKNSMAIVNMPLERGIAKLAGMEVFSMKYPSMKKYDVYENLEKGLKQMIKFAIRTLKKKGDKYNFCYIHFKETDVPGHDNKPLEKKRFLEILDKDFFSFIKRYCLLKKVKLIVTADHSTPCKYKTHTSNFVPLLLYNPEKPGDNNRAFNESEAKNGSLGKIYGKNVLKKCGFV